MAEIAEDHTNTVSGIVLEEKPSLVSLEKAAICLHFVDNPIDFEGFVSGNAEIAPPGPIRPICTVFCSMELDLLAAMFQDQHLIQTNLTYDAAAGAGHCIVDARFPAQITYTSEGVERTLRSRQIAEDGSCIIRCEARLAQTYFRESGIVVWHLILRAADGVFSEYELIKLMHLYEHDTELVDLHGRVEFDVSLPGDDHVRYRCRIGGLLSAVWSCVAGEQFREPPFAPPWHLRAPGGSERSPRAGTVQLVLGETIGGLPLQTVFGAVFEARSQAHPAFDGRNAASTSRSVKAWLRSDDAGSVGATLKALAGVTIGIFDFKEVDEEEVLDTLDPTFESGESFYKFHRRSLVQMVEADRGLNAIYDDVGISPYLILPHAVVLHDEELVRRVESSLNEFEESEEIDTLERLSTLARRVMRRMHVPNLFQYVTERTLFDSAFVIRGSGTKRDQVLDRMEALDGRLENAYEERRRRHDVVVQALLLLLTITQAFAVFVDDMPKAPFERALTMALLLATAGLYFIWRSRR